MKLIKLKQNINKLKINVLLPVFLRINVILLICAFFGIPKGHCIESKQLLEAIQKTDAFIQKSVEKNLIPGCAVAIVYRNQVIFINGYGLRKIGSSDKIDLDTVFQLGSVSKPISSTLASILEQKGYLKLNDPVELYIPEFKLNAKYYNPSLKIENILSHTSGVPRNGFNGMIESFKPFSEIVNALQKTRVIAPVGKRYDYHNAMYSLIGEITRSATRQSFAQALKNNLLSPLKMNRTSASFEEFINTDNRAFPHVIKRKRALCPCVPYSQSYYTVAPAGGINSSIRDMATFLKAQMGGYPQVVSYKAIQKIQTPFVSTHNNLSSDTARVQGRDPHYGLGWRIINFANNKMVYHGGWLRGFTNFIAFLPQEQLGIVVLHNADSRFSSKTAMKFFTVALNLPEIQESPEQALQPVKKNKKNKKRRKNTK